MKIEIEASPKEIAALIVATQERQGVEEKFKAELDGKEIASHVLQRFQEGGCKQGHLYT